MASGEAVQQYQFGPLERRGLIAGFRGGQVAVAAAGALVVIGAAINGHVLVAAALAVAVAVAGFVPIGGRSAEAWAPVLWAWFLKAATGGRRWTSDACRLGHLDGEPPAPTLPEHLTGLRILTGVAPDGGPMGMLREAGGGDQAAGVVLAREVATLASALATADVRVSGVLDPRGLARILREAFDPAARPGLARRAALTPDRAGAAPTAAWPTATDESWATFRADDTTHATYWVEEWPRTPVRPDFLSRLLLGTRATRTVSLTIEPVSPLTATRAVERARANDIADEGLRSRLGFLSSARKRREQEGTSRREEELADGHAECRFSGYVAVSAPTADALEDACGEIEQHARSRAVVLTRLRGQQAEAFSWTLPLCRGLR